MECNGFCTICKQPCDAPPYLKECSRCYELVNEDEGRECWNCDEWICNDCAEWVSCGNSGRYACAECIAEAEDGIVQGEMEAVA